MEINVNKLTFGQKRILTKYNYEKTSVRNVVELEANDLDEFAQKINHGSWHVVELTRSGSTYMDVIFFNWFTEDYERDKAYHTHIDEVKDGVSNYEGYRTREQAEKSLERLEQKLIAA